MFGIIFQECFEPNARKVTYLLNAHRLMWVSMSMLLVMAFCGNLKSSLMVNTFYDQTMSIDDILVKDLTFHTTDSMCAMLQTTAPISPLSNSLLQQTKKEDSQSLETTYVFQYLVKGPFRLLLI